MQAGHVAGHLFGPDNIPTTPQTVMMLDVRDAADAEWRSCRHLDDAAGHL